MPHVLGFRGIDGTAVTEQVRTLNPNLPSPLPTPFRPPASIYLVLPAEYPMTITREEKCITWSC